MAELDNLNLPKTIGRYQVLRLLGSGAMGSVVLAEDPRIKRKVAIKLMKLDAVKTETDKHEHLLRFQREAEVSGLLNHPGIVAIYDVGEEEGYGPFLAMEFVPGKPLDGLMKEGGTLPSREKLRIAAGLAEALDHAHAKGIVHRDVKPGNAMVGEDGRTKLMDFGIAKLEDANLTQTGTFLGTPSYASPEQIREGKVDSRSDIFSFGVLVFELMSGQSPFPGSSINTILYRIVNEPPVEVQPPVLGILPDGWRRVFDKVLSKRPEDRYATCTAFVRDLLDTVLDITKEDRRELLGLLKVTGDSPIPEIRSTAFDETMVVARPEPRGTGRIWLAAAAVALLAVGGWFLSHGTKAARLQIESQPAGAKVFVNDLAVGTTPMNQSLQAGDTLRLELKGFRPLAYAFKPGEAPPAFALEPVVTEELIDSVPAGATVVLDEKAQEGVTPLKVLWNQGQAHRLTLTKENLGYASDFASGEIPGGRAFELKESSTAESRQEPPLDPNAPGNLKLAGGFGVRVKVDGKDMGDLTPGAKLALPPGTHKVDMASAKHYFKDSRSLSVIAGQTAPLNLPALATLTVETFPGTGKVLVDGQDTGIESDGSSVKVAEGRHTITVRGPKGSKNETVELHGDKGLRFPL
ncbi:serine/threonine-protein kinase [Geothrix fuzhouensis]|uniref:serine/threonine-protein kinase n=1 Tax=Geothrix fuzhouensis TaxID=2966451 RepID=UPI00214780B4|nr:serine/threonine-protein kinase [Geothrix fuzhouensis]